MVKSKDTISNVNDFRISGADVVGINCNFGPKVALKAMRLMKEALDKAGLKTYLMCQPIGFFTPEVESGDGYLQLPEHFLGKRIETSHVDTVTCTTS